MKHLGASISSLMAAMFSGGAVADFAPPRRSGAKPEGGAGAKRAAQRLALKIDASKSIPDGTFYSRQRARAKQREGAKRARQQLKANAMQGKRLGGAAAV